MSAPTTQRLRAVRKARGLTLQEVGARVGVSHAAIHQYETGRNDPSLAMAKKLAAVLGTTLDDLFGNDPDHANVRA